jgi:hypothetical protein
MDKGTVVHYDVDYEQELFLLLSGQTGEIIPFAQEGEYVKEFLSEKYGALDINWDVIDIECVQLVTSTIEGLTKRWTEMRYGNLYSFVLLHGIYVPYYEWVYELYYAGPQYAYNFDPSTRKCKKIPLPLEVNDRGLSVDALAL